MERLSQAATAWAGSTAAFISAAMLLIVRLLVGPIFHYSDTWQLVINTFTTIVTFLMVFLIQRSQNKASDVVSLKLNELITALEGASNRLVDIESLSEEEIRTLRDHYRELVEMSKRESSLLHSHSIEEAATRHRLKTPRMRSQSRRMSGPQPRTVSPRARRSGGGGSTS